MKADKTNVQINPALIGQQQGIVPTDEVGQIKKIEKEQGGHSAIDAMQAQPPRTEQGDASSNVDRGESSQLQLRKQQRSSGVRTKKLKTEVVGSMARPGRAAFHQVHDVVGQAKNLLGTKVHQEPTRE